LSENLLAEKYNCSRTPIRERFKQLESDGLVIIKPKSGTYVKEESLKEFIDLMEIRTYLECLAYRLFIEQESIAPLKLLEKYYNKMKK